MSSFIGIRSFLFNLLLLTVFYIQPSISFITSIDQSLDCVGTHQCFNRTISCSEHTDHCIVHCSGEAACSFSTIICPSAASARCSVTCNDTSSCSHMTITAPNAMSLDINSNGNNALSFSQIYCPFNPSNNSCNIAYTGTQHGLNNIDIYSVNAYDTINLQCNSISGCWGNDHNPVLHFGDTQYSNICTIYDVHTCATTVLSVDHHSPFKTTAHSHDTSVSTRENDHNIYYAVMLVSIGLVSGVILSICCCVCLLLYQTQKHKVQGLRIGHLHSIRMGKAAVSPSLKHLSPRLQPEPSYIIELPFDHEPPVITNKKHETMNSMQVEVDTTMNLAEYTEYVDFVNEGLPNSFKETPTGVRSVSFVVHGSSEDEVTNGETPS
eukprot:130505_1